MSFFCTTCAAKEKMATAPLNIGGAFPDMADGGMADEGHNS